LCAGPREAGGCEAIGPVGVGAAGVAVLGRIGRTGAGSDSVADRYLHTGATTGLPPLLLQVVPWPTSF